MWPQPGLGTLAGHAAVSDSSASMRCPSLGGRGEWVLSRTQVAVSSTTTALSPIHISWGSASGESTERTNAVPTTGQQWALSEQKPTLPGSPWEQARAPSAGLGLEPTLSPEPGPSAR